MAGEADWKWYAGPDDESYSLGPFDTRAEAIAAGQSEIEKRFHIIEACKGDMSRWLPSGERIIEAMAEAADEDGAFGENDYCELKGSAEAIAAAEADLASTLRAWFERQAAIFPKPWLFEASRAGEWIEGAETCPICDDIFEPDDLCATDIELSTCHADCLKDSPVVDLDTGEPTDKPVRTYRYGDLPRPAETEAPTPETGEAA